MVYHFIIKIFSGPATKFLAGIDRLDKDLTVGKLQGKFQNQVLLEYYLSFSKSSLFQGY
jgi:hypothetical protein